MAYLSTQDLQGGWNLPLTRNLDVNMFLPRFEMWEVCIQGRLAKMLRAVLLMLLRLSNVGPTEEASRPETEAGGGCRGCYFSGV